MARLPQLQQRTIAAAYRRALATRPDSPALIDATGEWSFAQSFEHAMRIAGGLRALGTGHQQPVAVMLDNSARAAITICAVTLGGMIEVPVNTTFRGEFLAHVLRNSHAETLVIEDHYLERIERIAPSLAHLRQIVVAGSATAPGAHALSSRFTLHDLSELEQSAPASPHDAAPEELFAYMYTSGTTGPSKGVRMPHPQAYTMASREEQTRPHEHDRMLLSIPLFHVVGQCFGFYQALIHRVPCVIVPAFVADDFLPTVRRHEITMTTLLGTMATELEALPEHPDDGRSPLEVALMAPVVHDVARFERRFQVQVGTAYGSAEIGLPLVARLGEVRGGECGFAREGFELKIVDREGLPVPTGECGELLVRPVLPHTVMAGYHEQPEQTAEILTADGWLRSGDGFRQDAEGRFHFTDRLRDVIRYRGEYVPSFELERVINEYPGVRESAVVAVPSELAEDEIKAVVAIDAEMRPSHAQLIWFLVDRLPLAMVPRYIEFVDELPKTASRKVIKRELRERGTGGAVWDREAAGIPLS